MADGPKKPDSDSEPPSDEPVSAESESESASASASSDDADDARDSSDDDADDARDSSDADDERDSSDSADDGDDANDDAGEQGADDDEHPGRPRADGELDPELMRLPKRRTKVGWLLSAAVMSFCLYWMVTLRDDLAFSRAGSEPATVEVAALSGQADERFVSSSLVPDRTQTARIWTGADLGIHAAPVLGSKGRVWLVTSGSAYAGVARYDNAYAGRIKRLGELPFFDRLRQYYADSPPPLVPVAVSALAAALGPKKEPLVSVHGDPFTPGADAAVEVLWQPAGRAWIVVSPEADGPGDGVAWKAALETRAGLTIRGEIEAENPGRVPTWTFEVAAPQGLAAIVASLAEAGLSAARVTAVEETLRGRFGELALDGEFVAVGQRRAPVVEVTQVMIAHRLSPKADAVVLIAGERPGDFWYILPLYLLNGLFFLLFGWALVRRLRGSLPPTRA